jgi:hypothetical protein
VGDLLERDFGLASAAETATAVRWRQVVGQPLRPLLNERKLLDQLVPRGEITRRVLVELVWGHLVGYVGGLAQGKSNIVGHFTDGQSGYRVRSES